MTHQDSKPTIRAVDSEFRGKGVVVELHPRFLYLRLKGTSQGGQIAYEDLMDIVLMREAKRLVGDVPKGKRR